MGLFPEYLNLTRLYLQALLDECDYTISKISEPNGINLAFKNRERINQVFQNMLDSNEYLGLLDKDPTIQTITLMTCSSLNYEERTYDRSPHTIRLKKDLVLRTVNLCSCYCQSVVQNARQNKNVSFSEFIKLGNMLKQTNYEKWSNSLSGGLGVE